MSDRTTLDLTPGSGGLRVTGLRKSYRKRPVIRDVSLHLDRAYILHDGHVLMSGTTEEVVRDENVRRVYLGQGFRIG